jgi:hypothetical protein
LDATPLCVRRRLRRLATAALTAAVVFGLCVGGCDSAKAGFFSDAAGRLFGRSSTRMDLAPIVGAPANVAKQFAQELAAAGTDNKLTITPDGTGSPYTLKGYLVATGDKKGAKVSYILDITDTKGQRIGRVSGEQLVAGRSGSDPWSGVDSAALHGLAAKIAPEIAATMSGGSPPPVASTPAPAPSGGGAATSTVRAPKGPVTTIVAPVSGAPGDGTRSLTAAIKKRLYAKGVKLATVPTGNTYTVKGIVSVTDGSGGKQSIRIEWQVLDPNGKRVGTVSQQNSIPKGSLDGPWGAIADAAAGAAADGIIKLLPKSSG